MLKVPPAQMREALHETYRLRPDKRFLLAAGEVERLFSGKEAVPATATFKEDHWEIQAAGDSLGTVPELPDFTDYFARLKDYAVLLNRRSPAPLSAGAD